MKSFITAGALVATATAFRIRNSKYNNPNDPVNKPFPYDKIEKSMQKMDPYFKD